MKPAGTYETPLAALAAAVASYGGQAATARARNVSQPSVWRWVNQAKRLPAEHVRGVEADTGVSRYDLRPDIYSPDEAPASHPPGLDALEAAR